MIEKDLLHAFGSLCIVLEWQQTADYLVIQHLVPIQPKKYHFEGPEEILICSKIYPLLKIPFQENYHFFAEFTSRATGRKILGKFHSKGLIYQHVLREGSRMNFRQVKEAENLIEISHPFFPVTRRKNVFQEFISISTLINDNQKSTKRTQIIPNCIKGQIAWMNGIDMILIKDLSCNVGIVVHFDFDQFYLSPWFKRGSIVMIKDTIWVSQTEQQQQPQLRFAHFSKISHLADASFSLDNFTYSPIYRNQCHFHCRFFKSFLTICSCQTTTS